MSNGTDDTFYRTLLDEAPVPPEDRPLTRSAELFERASALIPSASQTFSKSTSQFVQGVAPTFLERGKGCFVWDVDGNRYIDHAMALGPVILGHSSPEVDDAVRAALGEGITFTLPHPLEIEVAEMLVERIPCAESVRFGKNGSDATTGAVRAARAITGRDLIAASGYHGWHDWFIGTTTRNAGIPDAVAQQTKTFRYNDLDSLQALFDSHPGQIAAVIMEPVGVEEPTDGFLPAVKELTHANGALLIFDEIITGFRFAAGGAQEYFGTIPDLACFGKALANGFPLSAVVGRAELMKVFDEAFFSFTFGGETVALAAAKATLTRLAQPDVLPHIAEHGTRLRDGFNAFAHAYGIQDHASCLGLPPRTSCRFASHDSADRLVLKSLFQQECLKRGVLFNGGHMPSLSHGRDEIDATLRVYRTAMEILADALAKGDALERLEGPPVQDVFRAP